MQGASYRNLAFNDRHTKLAVAQLTEYSLTNYRFKKEANIVTFCSKAFCYALTSYAASALKYTGIIN